VVLVHVFGVEVWHDVCRFGSGEQRNTCAIAQEADVAVVRYDVDGGVPGYASRGRLACARVVYGADVAAVEADAGAALEEGAEGWVGGGHEEGCYGCGG